MVRRMGERTQYQPGTFSWVELACPDQDLAKDFYGKLLGWQADDQPMGDGQVYSMMLREGKHVAAIAPQPQVQREAGMPAVWNNYISVADADASAQRAAELGATVHAGPFDVFEAGRMAVIQDPQGAFFCIWQARDRIGAELVNAPGALSWNELSSPDPDASAAFYGGLFGWTFSPMEDSPTTYLIIMNGEHSNGGIRELNPGTPPHWLAYFAVEDIEAALAQVQSGGGTPIFGPQDIGIAKIAVAHDSQGAVFALYAGRLDP
jgi:uncharacterized protein